MEFVGGGGGGGNRGGKGGKGGGNRRNGGKGNGGKGKRKGGKGGKGGNGQVKVMKSETGAPIAAGGGGDMMGNSGGGKANPLSRTSSTTRAEITTSRFADLAISAESKQAIAEVLRYETMTKCQVGEREAREREM
jgi:hypothetical protein